MDDKLLRQSLTMRIKVGSSAAHKLKREEWSVNFTVISAPIIVPFFITGGSEPPGILP